MTQSPPARIPALVALCLAGWGIGCHTGSAEGTARVGLLRIGKAFAFQPVTKDEAAVYFEVRNDAEAADTLVQASTDIAASATFHEHGSGGGRAGMPEVLVLTVPAHGTLTLEPGRLHLMLMNLARLPIAGERFALTLVFRSAGAVRLEVPVRSYAE